MSNCLRNIIVAHEQDVSGSLTGTLHRDRSDEVSGSLTGTLAFMLKEGEDGLMDFSHHEPDTEGEDEIEQEEEEEEEESEPPKLVHI